MGKSNVDELPLQFTSHPPERGRVGNIEPACAGASSCCCCCCLHTLGGLVGALTYSLKKPEIQLPLNQEERDYQETFSPDEASSRSQIESTSGAGLSVSSIYWLSVLMVSLMVLIIGTLIGMGNNNPRSLKDASLITGFFMLMAFPVIQLVAAILAYVVIAAGGGQGTSRAYFRQVDRITMGMVFGTIIGIFVLCAGVLILRK